MDIVKNAKKILLRKCKIKNDFGLNSSKQLVPFTMAKHKQPKMVLRKKRFPIFSVTAFCSLPRMGDNSVVKVHYRLGSRNC